MEDALRKCFELLMFSFSTLFLPRHTHLAHTEPGVTQVLFRSGHIDGGVRHAGNLIHRSLISLQAVWVLPFDSHLIFLPSLPLLGPCTSDHFWLIASATMLVTPGRCLMSTMFRHMIDSSHCA